MRLSIALIAAASLLASSAIGSPLLSEMDRVKKGIHTFLEWQKSRTVPSVAASVCKLDGDSSKCPISAMPKSETSLVQPGGGTRCIFGDSSPFQFQVIPGASDKLLFYFQGGGACFNEASTDVDLCSDNADPMGHEGILDRTNPKNAFADYTAVVVLYCSGDIFGGNVTRPYERSGAPVVQTGLLNTQATLDWVRQQQKTGALASTFSQLTIAGDSAGAIGAQIWAADIFDTLPASHRAALPDSYVGFFPTDVIPGLIKNFGICPWLTHNATLQRKCESESLQFMDIVHAQIYRYPDVTWQWAISKADAVEILFYDAVSLTEGSKDGLCDGEKFYKGAQGIISGYPASNAVAFFVDGETHTFTPQGYYFDTDTKGSFDFTPPFLYDWYNNATNPSATRCERCNGPAQDPGTAHGTDYCSSALVGRCAH